MNLKKFDWKKILIASVAIWIFGIVFMMLTCASLFQWVYSLPPNIWQPAEIIMSPNNMLISNVWGFIVSVIFVWVYALIAKSLPGKGIMKGVWYGIVLWLTGALSGMASMSLYMTINTTVVVYWVVQALVSNLIRGAIVAGIYKVK